jgi:hypothetical protein
VDKNLRLTLLTVLSTVGLASCGGGDSTPAVAPVSAAAQAAMDTVAGNALCSEATLGSYYWEIGNQSGILASGTVGSGVDDSTLMNIASASKWIYAAYVVEQKGGVPDPSADVPFLNFTSGHANFQVPICRGADGTVDPSVGACLLHLNTNDNQLYGAQVAGGSNPAGADVTDVFAYDSGHMQVHANINGLGDASDDALATAIVPVVLGSGASFTYSNPQLAGGGNTNAATYRIFLKRLLADSPSPLKMGALLQPTGSDPYAVATTGTPTSGPGAGETAISPISEPWHYGLGHWIEDNNATDSAALNAVNDGSYNSGGALGFYPWVNSDRTMYGILARNSSTTGNEGYDSAQCGRLIRLAYVTQTSQATTTP